MYKQYGDHLWELRNIDFIEKWSLYRGSFW